MVTQTLENSAWVVQVDEIEKRKQNCLLFCSLLFVGALFVADATTVKLFSYHLFGMQFLVPAGTLAFSTTFLATDVICEITKSRAYANRVVFIALSLRVLAFCYYWFVIGGNEGRVPFLELPDLWTEVKQQHFRFVLGATARIAVSGLISASVSFLIDTYVFTALRVRWQGKNLYWLRNGITTTFAQVVNSTIFITIAFGDTLSVDQIALTATGQISLKILFAWADTPLALLLRNYGQGRKYWYAIWKRDFYVG